MKLGIINDKKANKITIPNEINTTNEKINQLSNITLQQSLTLHLIENIVNNISLILGNTNVKESKKLKNQIDVRLKILPENKTEFNENMDRYNYTLLQDEAKSEKPENALGLENNNTENIQNFDDKNFNTIESSIEDIEQIQNQTLENSKENNSSIDFSKFFGAKFSNILFTDEQDEVKTTTEEPFASTEQDENDYDEYDELKWSL